MDDADLLHQDPVAGALCPSLVPAQAPTFTSAGLVKYMYQKIGRRSLVLFGVFSLFDLAYRAYPFLHMFQLQP